MPDFDPIAYIKEAGGVLKLGSGVLGKSAIALGIVMLASLIAIWRLHSDVAIVITLLIAVAAFFSWFFPVIRFAEKHPDVALLEGSEWSGFHRFQAAAKGYVPTPQEKQAVLSPGAQLVQTNEAPKDESDKEP